MEKLTLYKNKDEVFNCQLEIEGATTATAQVRFLLEINNKTLLFHGKISEDGSCSIPIPRLHDIADSHGKVKIEAIVENMYFPIYEAEATIKNSVEVKMSKKEEPKKESFEPKIKLSKIAKETNEPTIVKELKEEKEIKGNPYVAKSNLPNFQDYLKKGK